jgi:hypothetical protein
MKTIEIRIRGKRRYWVENGELVWAKSNINYEEFLTEALGRNIQDEIDKEFLDAIKNITLC